VGEKPVQDLWFTDYWNSQNSPIRCKLNSLVACSSQSLLSVKIKHAHSCIDCDTGNLVSLQQICHA
jgi:hypothetical protein